MAAGLVFTFISYLSAYMAINMLAICIACGLYYAAEMAEEYSSTSKRVITYTIYAVWVLHLLLLLEGFPLFQIAFSALTHLSYFLLLPDFPIFRISVNSLGAVGALIVDHYIWMRYFMTQVYSTLQVMGFFLLLVWLVPFSLFISLSSLSDLLPLESPGRACSLGSPVTASGCMGGAKKGHQAGGLVRGMLESIHQYFLPAKSEGKRKRLV